MIAIISHILYYKTTCMMLMKSGTFSSVIPAQQTESTALDDRLTSSETKMENLKMNSTGDNFMIVLTA